MLNLFKYKYTELCPASFQGKNSNVCRIIWLWRELITIHRLAIPCIIFGFCWGVIGLGYLLNFHGEIWLVSLTTVLGTAHGFLFPLSQEGLTVLWLFWSHLVLLSVGEGPVIWLWQRWVAVLAFSSLCIFCYKKLEPLCGVPPLKNSPAFKNFLFLF